MVAGSAWGPSLGLSGKQSFQPLEHWEAQGSCNQTIAVLITHLQPGQLYSRGLSVVYKTTAMAWPYLSLYYIIPYYNIPYYIIPYAIACHTMAGCRYPGPSTFRQVVEADMEALRKSVSTGKCFGCTAVRDGRKSRASFEIAWEAWQLKIKGHHTPK